MIVCLLACLLACLFVCLFCFVLFLLLLFYVARFRQNKAPLVVWGTTVSRPDVTVQVGSRVLPYHKLVPGATVPQVGPGCNRTTNWSRVMPYHKLVPCANVPQVCTTSWSRMLPYHKLVPGATVTQVGPGCYRNTSWSRVLP